MRTHDKMATKHLVRMQAANVVIYGISTESFLYMVKEKGILKRKGCRNMRN